MARGIWMNELRQSLELLEVESTGLREMGTKGKTRPVVLGDCTDRLYVDQGISFIVLY